MNRNLVAALVVLAALGAVAYAAPADLASPSADVDICVKPNGQLRGATQASPCSSPEELQRWTVHGVAGVDPGPGLVGREGPDGIVALSLDPDLIQQANAGRIFAGFDDGPGLANGLSRRLPLPPGAYAIAAKLTLTAKPETPQPPEVKYSHVVSCRLEAGADFDESRVVVSGTQEADATKTLTMPLEVVHRFAEPGEAELTCDTRLTFECAPFACIDDLGPKYEDLKIVATRAAALSNQFLD